MKAVQRIVGAVVLFAVVAGCVAGVYYAAIASIALLGGLDKSVVFATVVSATTLLLAARVVASGLRGAKREELQENRRRELADVYYVLVRSHLTLGGLKASGAQGGKASENARSDQAAAEHRLLLCGGAQVIGETG